MRPPPFRHTPIERPHYLLSLVDQLPPQGFDLGRPGVQTTVLGCGLLVWLACLAVGCWLTS